MPPKRRNPRNAHPVVQSDYDTDTANLTDVTPALAPPPARTNTELNMAVLRKYIPNLEQIVGIAPFAVVYTFSPEAQSWEKCGMEGTLFVCQLSDPVYPRWCVMILNRKSMDNFFAELKSPDDVEVTDEYVIMQDTAEDGTPQIFGLWIFSDGKEAQNTREVVAQTIQQCASWAQGGARERVQPSDNALPMDDSESGFETQPPFEQEQKTSGQQISINDLFGTLAPNSHGAVQPPQPTHQGYGGHNMGFPGQQGHYQQQQGQPPPSQQNPLLSLFNSAR